MYLLEGRIVLRLRSSINASFQSIPEPVPQHSILTYIL